MCQCDPVQFLEAYVTKTGMLGKRRATSFKKIVPPGPWSLEWASAHKFEWRCVEGRGGLRYLL